MAPTPRCTSSIVEASRSASRLEPTSIPASPGRSTASRRAAKSLQCGARGDGRTIVMVPEIKHNQTVGITLLHVRFSEHLAPAPMRAVLEGYQERYSALVDAVTETESTFDDERLGSVSVVDLLSEPVYVLADHWRTR